MKYGNDSMRRIFDDILAAKDAADRSYNGICDMVDAEYNRLFDNGGDMLIAEIPFTWKESGGNEAYTVAGTYPMDTDGVMRFTGSVYDNGRNHDIFTAGAESRRLALEVIRQYRLGNITYKEEQDELE